PVMPAPQFGHVVATAVSNVIRSSPAQYGGTPPGIPAAPHHNPRGPEPHPYADQLERAAPGRRRTRPPAGGGRGRPRTPLPRTARRAIVSPALQGAPRPRKGLSPPGQARSTQNDLLSA